MKQDALKKFLILAKRSTYANQDAPKTVSLRPSSYDYHFEDGEFVYHDTYFGGKNFIGEEIVYQNGQPIWGMNYSGRALVTELIEQVFDKSLRPALILVGKDTEILPLRGPKEYTNGDWKYNFTVSGEFNDFTGLEEVSKNGEVIYRLYCHGGEIR